MEEELVRLGGQMVKQQTGFRRQERQWLSEREAISRKLQYLQQYGAGAMVGETALHTGYRAEARTAGEKRLKTQVSKLTTELAEKDGQLSTFRQKLLDMEQEEDRLRTAATAAGEQLARRSRVMAEQVAVVTERADKLERRRAREAEGYQSDIKLLRDKMHRLENQLIGVTTAKANGKENEHVLQSLRRALDEVDENRPNEWKS